MSGSEHQPGRVGTFDKGVLNQSFAKPDSVVGSLTKRQFEILREVARGESNQTIADQLGIAVNSVGNHLIAIYDALGIPDDKNARVTAVLHFLNDTVHVGERISS